MSPFLTLKKYTNNLSSLEIFINKEKNITHNPTTQRASGTCRKEGLLIDSGLGASIWNKVNKCHSERVASQYQALWTLRATGTVAFTQKVSDKWPSG